MRFTFCISFLNIILHLRFGWSHHLEDFWIYLPLWDIWATHVTILSSGGQFNIGMQNLNNYDKYKIMQIHLPKWPQIAYCDFKLLIKLHQTHFLTTLPKLKYYKILYDTIISHNIIHGYSITLHTNVYSVWKVDGIQKTHIASPWVFFEQQGAMWFHQLCLKWELWFYEWRETHMHVIITITHIQSIFSIDIPLTNYNNILFTCQQLCVPTTQWVSYWSWVSSQGKNIHTNKKCLPWMNVSCFRKIVC